MQQYIADNVCYDVPLFSLSLLSPTSARVGMETPRAHTARESGGASSLTHSPRGEYIIMCDAVARPYTHSAQASTLVVGVYRRHCVSAGTVYYIHTRAYCWSCMCSPHCELALRERDAPKKPSVGSEPVAVTTAAVRRQRDTLPRVFSHVLKTCGPLSLFLGYMYIYIYV